ncbi:binding-protein-dependent transport system inner membrane protein [Spirochaetia bacterium]|nr:binding-protein-dependent transport system inner membrane protein [Spirochaetia bacterium]
MQTEQMLKVRRSKLGRADKIWGTIFVAPQMFGALAFMFFPIVFSFFLCFTEWKFAGSPHFIGITNFISIFTDKTIITSILNTLEFVVIVVPLNLFFSLCFAMLLDHKIFGRTIFRTLYFLPNVTSSIAASLVWVWIYNPDFGMLNGFLEKFGIYNLKWLSDIHTALPSIAIVVVWQSIGNNIIIFLAGLNNISQTMYEAAEIDGANWWQRFRRITIPMLTPTIFFVVIMGFIGAFQIFNEPYVMTVGGPGKSTFTMVLYLYILGFQYFRMGEAAVVSWVLFIMIAIVTFIQFKFQNRWVNYDV